MDAYLHSSLCHPLLRFWCSGSPSLKCSDFMYPVFVTMDNYETISLQQLSAPKGMDRTPTNSQSGIPGVERIALSNLIATIGPLVQKGLKSVLLFATIADDLKDARGTAADSPNSNPALRAVEILSQAFPRLLVACDLCLCNFTSHGHCGILKHIAKNDATSNSTRLNDPNKCPHLVSANQFPRIPINNNNNNGLYNNNEIDIPSHADSGLGGPGNENLDGANEDDDSVSQIANTPATKRLRAVESLCSYDDVTRGAKVNSNIISPHVAIDENVKRFEPHSNTFPTSGLYRDFLDNFASVARLVEIGLAYSHAGAHIIAPSDMMDGRIGALKRALIAHGLQGRTAVMSYSAKFASALYGPFRDMVGCRIKSLQQLKPQTSDGKTSQATGLTRPHGDETSNAKPGSGHCLISNDRSTYQLPVGSAGLALRALERDVREGADILMVKPATLYLDIVRSAKARFPAFPLAVYHVSGEYTMLYHAAQAGCIDLETTLVETILCMKRAGADIIITYFTPLLLDILAKTYHFSNASNQREILGCMAPTNRPVYPSPYEIITHNELDGQILDLTYQPGEMTNNNNQYHSVDVDQLTHGTQRVPFSITASNATLQGVARAESVPLDALVEGSDLERSDIRNGIEAPQANRRMSHHMNEMLFL